MYEQAGLLVITKALKRGERRDSIATRSEGKGSDPSCKRESESACVEKVFSSTPCVLVHILEHCRKPLTLHAPFLNARGGRGGGSEGDN